MADILDETHDEIKEAQGQVGTENKYLQEIEIFLTRVKQDPEQYGKNKSKISHAINYAGRTEARAEREERKIAENLKKLAEEVPDTQKKKILAVANEFSITEKTLIDESSRYSGDIKDKLNKAGIQAQLMITGKGNEASFNSTMDEAIDAVHKAVVYTGTMLAVLQKCDVIIAELKAMLVG